MAAQAPACEERILADWAEDGRVDGLYDLPCYEAAIESLPPDLRDYSDAAEVIGRALTAALRSVPPGSDESEDRALQGDLEPSAGASSPLGPPVALALLGALGLGLIVAAAATVAHLRRRREGHPRRRTEGPGR